MAVTPFDEVPKNQFITRMIGPSIGIWIIGWLCVGLIANSPSFQEAKGPAAVLPMWEASAQHYHTLFKAFSEAPSVCWSGSEVNDFQKTQCNRFWEIFFKFGALGLLPFGGVGLFYYIGLETIAGTFRKVRKKIKTGKVALSGVVTQPPDAPSDTFSWLYCVKPITVQLANKTQMTVYISLDAPDVRPGQTMVLFEAGKILGEKRYLAMLYAPHVAVIKGA